MTATKRKVDNHGNERWLVDFGVQPNGKRLREFHESEQEVDDAITKAERVEKRYGDLWLQMTPPERNELMGVQSEVKKAGLQLRAVWDFYKKENGEKPVSKSKSFKDAVEELRTRKTSAGRDERYVEELCELLLRFGVGRLEQHMDQISVREVQTWINAQEWGLHAKKSNYGRFASLWKMCKDMGWVSYNVVDRLEPIGKLKNTARVWPNDRCFDLLAATRSNEVLKKITHSIALGMMGCMRPEEVTNELMSWKFIDLKTGKVDLPAEITKDGDQRVYFLQPTALAWVQQAKKDGCEFPVVNERRLIDACCELAGIDDWPHDILRKCCATHLSAVYKKDWNVINDMGNSVRILLKSYKALKIPQEQSDEFWKFGPAAAEKRLKQLLTRPAPKASETAKHVD